MADAGYIAPEEVRHHNKRNVLTNFLGGHGGKVKADVRWLRLKDADRLLLCSDGLNDMVDDEAIARSASQINPPMRRSHCSMKHWRGGRDNVTVIVAATKSRRSASSARRTSVCSEQHRRARPSGARNRRHRMARRARAPRTEPSRKLNRNQQVLALQARKIEPFFNLVQPVRSLECPRARLAMPRVVPRFRLVLPPVRRRCDRRLLRSQDPL